MVNFSYILSLTSPIFLLIGLGYAVVRFKYLGRDAIKTFAWFIINFALPAALFKALSSRSFSDILHFDYLLIFGLGSLLSFTLLFLIAKTRNKNLTQCAIFGLGGSISNSLMIGFPIVMQLFGEAALVPFALTLIIENIIVLPIALAIADVGQQDSGGFFKALLKSIPQLLKNPIILSIVCGLTATITGVQLPSVLDNAVQMLASTVAGLALFTLGGMLVGINARSMALDISTIVSAKLIMHPLAVVFMVWLFPPMPQLFQSAAIVLACVPMFSIYAMFGARYHMPELTAAVLLPATVLSFFTLNIAIWLLDIPLIA
jgi:predicted permease